MRNKIKMQNWPARRLSVRVSGRLIAASVSAFVLATAAPRLSRALPPSLAEGAIPVVPSTVKLQQLDAKGTPEAVTTIATRSDGSQVIATEQIRERRRLRTIHFASGEVVFISDYSHEKSTVFDPAHTASEWLREPRLKCVKPAPAKESLVGIEDVGGYRSAKVAITSRSLGWFALDYGCAELQYSVPWNKTNSRFFQFVSLTTGEPPADLFAVPADYEEVPPSKLFGSAKESDAYYYAHRPR